MPKNLKFSHHIIISIRTLKRRCLGLSLFRTKQQADWIRGKKCEHQMQGYNLLRGNFFKVLLIVRAGYRTSVLLWHWPFMAVRLHVIAACRKNTYVVTRDTSWLRPQTGFTCICVVNCSCVCVVELVKKCRQKKKKKAWLFHFSKIDANRTWCSKSLWLRPAKRLIWWSTWLCMESI